MSKPDREWKTRISQARKSERKLAKRIKNARSRDARRKAIWDYLTSFDVRLVKTLEANRDLRPHRRRSRRKVMRVAEKVDPFTPTPKPVRFWLAPKKNGGWRPICDFPLTIRAGQLMVRAVLDACPIRLVTYSQRGVPEALKKCRATVEKGGICYALRADVKSFYMSFAHPYIVSSLPIPKAVTANTVLIGRGQQLKELKGGNKPQSKNLSQGSPDDAAHTARQGIPQGSLVSPLIADRILSEVIRSLSLQGTVIVYVDDVLILGSSKQAVQEDFKTLRSALAEHPGGPLTLRRVQVSPLTVPIDFLGHTLRQHKDGTLGISFSDWAFHMVCQKIGVFQNWIEDCSAGSELAKSLLTRAKTFLEAWCNAFQMADDLDMVRDMLEPYLKSDARAHGLDWDKLPKSHPKLPAMEKGVYSLGELEVLAESLLASA